MRHCKAWTPLWVALALACPPAGADIIIGNLSAGLGLGTNFGQGTTTVYKAVGFQPQRDYILGEVTLTMDFAGGGGAVVEVWEGAVAPASVIMTLDSPAQIGAGEFVFTPPAELVMRHGRTYWIYLRADPAQGGTFLWQGTSPPRIPSGPARHIAYIFNGNPSSTFNRFQVEGTCYADCSGDMRVDIFDFLCFQDAFVTMAPYADCTSNGVIDIFDFLCFQDAFVIGCR